MASVLKQCSCRHSVRASRSTTRPVQPRLGALPAPCQAWQRHQRDVVVRFFKFGNKGSEDAGIYGSQGRDDYSVDDVEHYFNYMGMLAVEGTYDRMEAMLSTGLAPVDVLLLMAASEDDSPKVEELLKAGANTTVRDNNGKTPLDLCTKPEIKALLEGAAVKA